MESHCPSRSPSVPMKPRSVKMQFATKKSTKNGVELEFFTCSNPFSETYVSLQKENTRRDFTEGASFAWEMPE